MHDLHSQRFSRNELMLDVSSNIEMNATLNLIETFASSSAPTPESTFH